MAASAKILPLSVSVDVLGRAHRVHAFEISGHRASMQLGCALPLDGIVRMIVGWTDGSSTTLPARVRAVAPISDAAHPPGEHVAYVDVEGVEGDWRPLLAYLGPAALAS